MVHGGSFARGGWRLAGSDFVSIIGSFLFLLENKRPAVLRLMTATSDCSGLSGCSGSGIFRDESYSGSSNNNNNAEVDDDDGGEEKNDGWATTVGGLGRENTTSQSIAAPRICT